MKWRIMSSASSRRRGKLAAVVLAAGMVVPGVFIACTPAMAGAQSTDPLGPTIAQVEVELAYALAQSDLIVSDAEGWLSPSCIPGLAPPFSGPDPYCFPYLGGVTL